MAAEDRGVEAEGQFEGRLGGGESGGVDVRSQQVDVACQAAGASCVGGEGRDAGGQGGGPQFEAGEQLLGEVNFVSGGGGIGEGEDEGTLGLTGGALTGDTVLLGLAAVVGVGLAGAEPGSTGAAAP
ncbi:hypothetical protein ABZ691_33475 [Streptomyces sp. NPDC006854]|uniref:hypothetical protein n=1 Tax=Streptomyces sp. NPDC006854 TaxID=3155115 RepID=UPI0033C88618